MYAVRRNGHDSIGVLRRRYAQLICSATTERTTYLVRGSGPQSFRTWHTLATRCLHQVPILKYLWVRFNNGLPTSPVRFLGIGPEEAVMIFLNKISVHLRWRLTLRSLRFSIPACNCWSDGFGNERRCHLVRRSCERNRRMAKRR